VWILTVVVGSPGEIRIRVVFVLPSAGLSSVRGSRAVYWLISGANAMLSPTGGFDHYTTGLRVQASEAEVS